MPVGDLRKLASRPPTKIILVDEPERVDRLAPEMAKRWGGRLYVARSRPDIVEMVHRAVNKGAALEWLARHLGVAIAETMAIGDAANDAPLLRAAGIGVAMPGSDPQVQAMADVVLDESESPVADAIRRLVFAS